MTQLDSTVVNLSFASGYLLALALMLPLNGWLVDRVGAKRL
jgi:MFS family permease